ncbi:zinc finger BED domain-containing protein RICESLEEPER 2-like [Silene latifolia]|uniref:zinc finger BED domain-containing protein RICESLEEPER 2-like n=1 Tax=Silene latifolia TaxID=37657 RepID=UPI003D76FAB6
MYLTAHFIDDNWVLHKRIINFCQLSGHSGKIIGKTVEKCLSEWNLKNILTVTVDNSSSNDVPVDYLKRKFNNSECDVMDGLHDLENAIIKIRTLCKYVKASPDRKEKFQDCIVEEKIECKSLVCFDVETRWNSTYLMLDIAIKFKKAFGCLLLKDSNLQKEMKKVGEYLTTDEWKQVSYFLPFLKIFYDATLKMSGSRYVTSNYYVEIIFGVGEVISQHLSHKDEGVRNMASKMKLKYDNASSSSTTTNIFPQTNKQDYTFNFGALLGNKFEMEMGGAENESKSELEKY